MDPITQIILGVLALAGITIPAILNYKQNRAIAADVKAARLEQIETDRKREEEAVEVRESVAVLAKNIDGATTEIKETIAAQKLAEGKLEGIAGEQARTAVESPPQPDAAQKQLDKIETIATEGAATSLRNEAAAIEVADRLVAQQKRADEHTGGEPGAAADAALKS